MDDATFRRERGAFRAHPVQRARAPDTRPFIVKYRPESLEHVVGHEAIIARLVVFVRAKNVPNLLFEGPPGVGKTTCGVCLANETLGINQARAFLWLNASDDRSASFVQTTLREFLRRAITLPAGSKRMVFLDEVDSMTREAQLRLKRLMDSTGDAATFLLACNDLGKVEEPVQARCVHFAFGAVAPALVAREIRRVAAAEKLRLDDTGVAAIVRITGGDVRRGLNALQACAQMHADEVLDEAGNAGPSEQTGDKGGGARANSGPKGGPKDGANSGPKGGANSGPKGGPKGGAARAEVEAKGAILDGAAVCRLCDMPDTDAVQAVLALCVRGDAFGAFAAADALVDAGFAVHDVLRTFHDLLQPGAGGGAADGGRASQAPLPAAARYRAFVPVAETLGHGRRGTGPACNVSSHTVHVFTRLQLRACVARMCVALGPTAL
jgi:hypothetical protein